MNQSLIFYVKGDLLKSDCDVIAHQANCFSTMGSGIAYHIKKKYPEAYQADKEFPLKPKERLGQYSIATVGGEDGKQRYIVNLYGQYMFGGGERHTNYEALGSALELMMSHIEGSNDIKVGVPYKMGCGLGGGDWDFVESILDQIANRYSVPIYIYVLPAEWCDNFDCGGVPKHLCNCGEGE